MQISLALVIIGVALVSGQGRRFGRRRQFIDFCFRRGNFNPVCGTDGQDYRNMNALRCAMRNTTGLRVFHRGNCNVENRFQQPQTQVTTPKEPPTSTTPKELLTSTAPKEPSTSTTPKEPPTSAPVESTQPAIDPLLDVREFSPPLSNMKPVPSPINIGEVAQPGVPQPAVV